MACLYKYSGRDISGQVLTGTIEAESEAAVALYLRDNGYYVTKIQRQNQGLNLAGLLDRYRRVTAKDLAIFCRQFAVMLDAGLSLVNCLDILIEQTANPRLKSALKAICREVQEGQTLAAAMQSHKTTFPNVMISMIEAGELGGMLDEVMNRLAVHFEKEYKVNEKVKNALTYPAMVLSLAVVVVGFILTFVLPVFIGLYDNMKGVQLPLLTRILIEISGFLRENLVYVVLALLLKIYICYRVWQVPKIQSLKDRFIIRLPVFGLLWRKIVIARFSRTLGTLMKSGVPVITALDIVRKTIDNREVSKALVQAQESIRRGLGLAVPLGNSTIFTPMVVQLIAVGEETGEVDKMLEKIADFYESEVEDVVGRLSSLLEPFLIGFLGLVIGVILVAVVTPMFDAITNLGN